MRFVVVDKEAVTFDDEHKVALVKVPKDVSDALNAIERMRELHLPIKDYRWGLVTCTACDRTYPCATIKALDGGQ